MKTNPIQSQYKANQTQFIPTEGGSNPIKANTMPKQTQPALSAVEGPVVSLSNLFQNQPRRPDKSGGLIIDVADGGAV